MTDAPPFKGVDFHCHLDLYPDHAAAISAAEAAGIYTLTVTTTPKAWPRNRDLTSGTRFVRAALGLHPQLVAERAHELSEWKRYLPEARYIGEVGLDAGPRFYSSFESQKKIFRSVLESCAEAGDKAQSQTTSVTPTCVRDSVPESAPTVISFFGGSKAKSACA